MGAPTGIPQKGAVCLSEGLPRLAYTGLSQPLGASWNAGWEAFENSRRSTRPTWARPWAHGLMGSWAHVPLDPWALGPMGPRAHGPLGPWTQRPLGPWAQGPLGPWTHVPLGPGAKIPKMQFARSPSKVEPCVLDKFDRHPRVFSKRPGIHGSSVRGRARGPLGPWAPKSSDIITESLSGNNANNTTNKKAADKFSKTTPKSCPHCSRCSLETSNGLE